ncbi:DNA polymerase III subunit gamma and tau [Schaalia sp. JY-X169]|uniref:DNA polymerase III subunit gamma and tau n=1 Tax=Schaalia sp. JY-X169 TaxID=2758572 RepID=UPI0015F6EE18|nr:DNA polymerase III subunit gamma and tau [Schaalia sp. JY-X169]
MSTALYRRYRPDTFQDVIGQSHVTDALQTALDSGRVTHAYLFSGPRGCGKTTSARILARSLNCAQGPTSSPCGVCDSCVELASGGPGSLDVVEIDAASNNKVEDARTLRDRVAFAPTRDRYRIFILDEAHMVTPQGFNALLKVVEEPPEHVKFIFATTEPDKVINTIRSRTYHYPFRLVAPSVLGPFLRDLAAKEGVQVDEGVYPLIIRSGGGSVRDSLSVLDQLIAGSDGVVTVEKAVELLGYTDASILERAVDALGDGDGAAAFRIVEEIIATGQEPRRFVEDLLQRLRDLMVCALAGERASDILVETPADQLVVMHTQASKWGSRLLSRSADIVESALREMSGATAPRLQLELLLARLLVKGQAPAVQPSMQDAPAPVQLAPARQVPARSIPAQSASAQSTSAQSAPAPQGPAPVQSTPARSAPAPQTGPPPARSVPADRPGASPALPQSDGDTQFPDAAFVRLHWVEIIEKMGQMGSVFPSLLRNFRGVEADGFTSHIFLLDPTTVNQFDRMGGSEKLALILSNMLEATVSVQAHWIEDLDNVIAGFGRGDESAEAEREPRADVDDSQTDTDSAQTLEPTPEPEPTPDAGPVPEPNSTPSYKGRPAVDMVLGILGGSVIDEKIVAIPSDAQSPGDFDGPEPVEPPEEELSAFDLDGEE